MKLFDGFGFVLHKRPYGERGNIVTLFTDVLGICKGFMYSAKYIQLGDYVRFHWKARTDNQLGVLKLESVESKGFVLLSTIEPLKCFLSAVELLPLFLPEHLPELSIFNEFHELLEALAGSHWRKAYALWELALLKNLGVALQLDKCVVNGTTHSLAYVSPRSGQAVSSEAGLPYKNKLFPLPEFLARKETHRTHREIKYSEMLHTLNLFTYFIEQVYPDRVIYAVNRTRLIEYIIQKQEAHAFSKVS